MALATSGVLPPRVVVGFDGSESSKDALVLARILAAMMGATLEVVCVYLYSPVRGRLASGESAQATVAGCARWLSTLQPSQETIVPALSVSDGLCQVAGAAAAEFVVVGSHGARRSTPFARTPARDLLREDPPFAVVTAPAGFALQPDPGLRRIGSVHDGSAADGSASSLAQRLSQLTRSEVESLSRSDAGRLHRAARARINTSGRTGEPSPRPVLGSAPDLLVVAEPKRRRIRDVRRSAFWVLSHGCTLPVVLASSGLDASSFMAGHARRETACYGA
jgi:nucleotide-binding universal stress UspA family protein